MSEVFKYKRLYKLNGVPTVDCVCGATVRFKSFMRHVETNKHKRKKIALCNDRRRLEDMLRLSTTSECDHCNSSGRYYLGEGMWDNCMFCKP